MVKQKHQYVQLIPVGQGLIFTYWWGSITPFVCQDLASRIKFSQFSHFCCVFSGKKTLTHGETKTKIWKIDASESKFYLHIGVGYYHMFFL
jgi:hypothetical protein